ncbi:MAG: hypothetical protein KJ556_01890 [Gammaproteobacteria bacterium]|nr:hypothetical protein [Gammaproteobacteria bacterium]MBU2057037.1 hypothetical protein [Gammaproteobacteria bacterium]MBU2173858.1 hypothetical protein [Gammaproteobacteria bacterium]MBU2249033.1 hypothetical protein [Gammaproteobacteria bacterium]MBU2343683.1 hypothetical protein [Gammaproteobacteria bacterium]
MKLILLPLLLLASVFTFAQQLDTPNYTVEIQELCPEGEVQCQNVLYKGTSKISGASIELKGSAWHSLCADGVTPCRFLGYKFNNGRIRYLVFESGLLQVIGSSGKVVLEEQGLWDYQQQDKATSDLQSQSTPDTKTKG